VRRIAMEYRRIEVVMAGDVTMVMFQDKRIVEDITITELGHELFRLVDVDRRKKILLNFSNVNSLSSAALGKLITLHKKVKSISGVLMLCNILPTVYEPLVVTKLNGFFDIKEDEVDALAEFK
jgi:anti-sigma B factor antagonist